MDSNTQSAESPVTKKEARKEVSVALDIVPIKEDESLNMEEGSGSGLSASGLCTPNPEPNPNTELAKELRVTEKEVSVTLDSPITEDKSLNMVEVSNSGPSTSGICTPNPNTELAKELRVTEKEVSVTLDSPITEEKSLNMEEVSNSGPSTSVLCTPNPNTELAKELRVTEKEVSVTLDSPINEDKSLNMEEVSNSGPSTSGLCTPNPNTELAKELRVAIYHKNILTTNTREKLLTCLEKMEANFQQEKNNTKKEKALHELVSSEAKYISQLKMLLDFFMTPITIKNLLMNDDFETLFGHVQTIYNINTELFNELNKGLGNVGNSFAKIAPFLKIYSVYACKYQKALKLLELAKIQNPSFAQFVENQESRPEVQTKLSALLITPIQRIPRYKLLLNDIFEQSVPSDPDFDILQDCSMKVEAAAIHINNLLEEQENAQKLLEIQRYFHNGDFNIVKPGRRLMKEGILHKFCPQKKHHEFYVVLTSDLIIFCKIKKSPLVSGSLKVEYIFPLNTCTVIESWEKGCFEVNCPPEQIILYHEDSAEMHRWIRDIQKGIATSIESRKSLKKIFSDKRAVKRKNIEEYHEVGLSPGQPLKKRTRHSPEKTSTMLSPRLILPRRPISACDSNPVPADKSDFCYVGYSLTRNSFLHCSGDSTSNNKEQTADSTSDTQDASRLSTFMKSLSSKFKNIFSWRKVTKH